MMVTFVRGRMVRAGRYNAVRGAKLRARLELVREALAFPLGNRTFNVICLAKASTRSLAFLPGSGRFDGSWSLLENLYFNHGDHATKIVAKIPYPANPLFSGCSGNAMVTPAAGGERPVPALENGAQFRWDVGRTLSFHSGKSEHSVDNCTPRRLTGCARVDVE